MSNKPPILKENSSTIEENEQSGQLKERLQQLVDEEQFRSHTHSPEKKLLTEEQEVDTFELLNNFMLKGKCLRPSRNDNPTKNNTMQCQVVSDDFLEIENPEQEEESKPEPRLSQQIIDEMKPLYYFNVKPSQEEEEWRKAKKAVGQAETPFFVGSPQSMHSNKDH